MRRAILMATTLGLGAVGGCATMPNVTLSYYPPKASAKITVTETVACDASKQNLVVASSTAVVVTGMADRSGAPYTLNFRDIGGTAADLDETFTLTDDGRLKGVNASSTGQGEAIVKSAVTLAATALAAGAAGGEKAPSSQDCQQIDTLGGAKPLTLTFSRVLWFRQVAQPGDITAGDLVADDLAKVALAQVPKLPVPTLAFVDGGEATPAASGKVSGDDVALKLAKIRQVTLTVTTGTAPPWTQDLLVPAAGENDLPIPKSKLFGKQGFTLSLSDVGAITSIGYSKTSGESGLLNAGNSIAGAAGPTAAQQAAEVKAQADLIAAQQRLVRCEANRAACT